MFFLFEVRQSMFFFHNILYRQYAIQNELPDSETKSGNRYACKNKGKILKKNGKSKQSVFFLPLQFAICFNVKFNQLVANLMRAFDFSPADLEILKTRLRNSHRVVIVSHQNPDGDAIGASLGLLNLLRRVVAHVQIIVPNDYPKYLKWMKSSEQVIVYELNTHQADRLILEADLIFCVDFNSPDRLGKMEDVFRNARAFKVLIDHHPMPENTFDLLFSTTFTSSASEMTVEVIEAAEMSHHLDHDVAECLLTGIISDTGSFSYGCNSARTYENVAKLLSYKVNRDLINSRIFNNFSESRMRLMGYCLNEKLTVYHSFHCGVISLSQAEMQRFNFQIGDTEGFVNQPLSISGVIFSAFFMETDNLVKVSLRSRGHFDVNRFARKYYNGGGHINAAGGRTNESLNTVLKSFVQHLENEWPLLQKAAADLANAMHLH